MTGVIDYYKGYYTIVVDGGDRPRSRMLRVLWLSVPRLDRETTVGSFNIENFSDDETNSIM